MEENEFGKYAYICFSSTPDNQLLGHYNAAVAQQKMDKFETGEKKLVVRFTNSKKNQQVVSQFDHKNDDVLKKLQKTFCNVEKNKVLQLYMENRRDYNKTY